MTVKNKSVSQQGLPWCIYDTDNDLLIEGRIGQTRVTMNLDKRQWSLHTVKLPLYILWYKRVGGYDLGKLKGGHSHARRVSWVLENKTDTGELNWTRLCVYFDSSTRWCDKLIQLSWMDFDKSVALFFLLTVTCWRFVFWLKTCFLDN